MIDEGGGASRSTDPAAGSSAATDVSLREFIEQRFRDLESKLNERRTSDALAVSIAKETADAALEAHNQLIKRMESQGIEAQRQLDKLTATYATKEHLRNLESLINQRLQNIEETLGAGKAGKLAVRGAFADLRGIILLGFTIMAGVIGLMVYLAQQGN